MRESAGCCGARKNHRAYADPRFFRPLPLVRVAPPATGGAPLIPRNLTIGSIRQHQKRTPIRVSFFGAGNRNRTGTDFTPRDFLTTIAFATRLVCGLDHAFTCSRWSVSGLYTFQGASLAWLGVATIKGFTEFTDIQNSHPWLSALFFDR